MTLKKSRLILVSTFISLMVSFVFSSCGNDSKKSTSTESPVKSISIAGSTSFQPFIQKSVESFKVANKNINILMTGTNRGEGLPQIASGEADIAMSDVYAEEVLSPEIAKTLTDTKICVQGFTFIVHPELSVDTLSQKQLMDIFTGKITNWRSLGGGDRPILIISRPTTSGIRTVIRKYAFHGVYESEANVVIADSDDEVKKAVSQKEGSISYVSLSGVKEDGSVKKIRFDNIEPSLENIVSGKYPLWSYAHLYYKAPLKDEVSAFIYALKTSTMTPTQKQMGYISIDEMKTTR